MTNTSIKLTVNQFVRLLKLPKSHNVFGFIYLHIYFQETVVVKVVFLKIGEIDTVKEHFDADIYIEARWREPLLDGRPPEPEVI